MPPSESPYNDKEIFPQLHTEICSFQAQGSGDLNAHTASPPDFNTDPITPEISLTVLATTQIHR